MKKAARFSEAAFFVNQLLKVSSQDAAASVELAPELRRQD